MTTAEYNAIREMIESRFRKDMAALERVWFTIHGVNPPESPVALAKSEDSDEISHGGGAAHRPDVAA
jgi:hypothetical protein